MEFIEYSLPQGVRVFKHSYEGGGLNLEVQTSSLTFAMNFTLVKTYVHLMFPQSTHL